MTEAEKKVSGDVAKQDLYGILGVQHDASEKALLKAYRKKALKCHPDKNPDNPAAAEMFHELSKALEILTDKAARAVYDKIVKARLASEQRTRDLDSKRRKLREDLEERERQAAATGGVNVRTAAQNLQAEVERLRKEGSRLLQEEQERLKQRLQMSSDSSDSDTLDPPRLKLKWSACKGDPNNGGYTRGRLLQTLAKYGEISALLLSAKKNGSAVVEFESAMAGQLAFENEKGLIDNPLTITWISGQPKPEDLTAAKISKASSKSSKSYNVDSASVDSPSFAFSADLVSGFSFNTSAPEGENSADGGTVRQDTGVGDTDFESLVFMRMRQAEERKRLKRELQDEQEEK